MDKRIFAFLPVCLSFLFFGFSQPLVLFQIMFLALLGFSISLACGYGSSSTSGVYLVDFSCFSPSTRLRIPVASFLEHCRLIGVYDQKTIEFQEKILRRSGLGEETSFPFAMQYLPPQLRLDWARQESESVIFTILDDLFAKTSINPKEDIGIMVVNCSIFNPKPSLAAMVINRYSMRSSIKTFNLSGMGCSAGMIAIDLVKRLLQVSSPTYALVVSTENITLNWYLGNDRAMLLPNCLFRVGGAAMLLSNRKSDKSRSKYALLRTVRTTIAQDELAYHCVFQQEDKEGKIGVTLTKDLMSAAARALTLNLTSLGPKVLPLSEQIAYAMFHIKRYFTPSSSSSKSIYVPKFSRAFQHFCIHAGGRALIDELEKKLDLSSLEMEASRMTLHRFGNLSSASVWYELAYTEAKQRVKAGDRVWQLGLGSGFKCNSVVWKALRDITHHPETGPWKDCIDNYPLPIQDLTHI